MPIDPRLVLVETFNAAAFDGNMFYVVRELSANEAYKEYDICVAARFRSRRRVRALLNACGFHRIRLVFWGWPGHSRALAAARFIFSDGGLHERFVKKNGQTVWNTWHGTPLKAMGRGSGQHVGHAQNTLVAADLLSNPNEHTEQCMLQSYMVSACLQRDAVRVLAGYPRNTAFFDAEAAAAARKRLAPGGQRLYAWLPTWRQPHSATPFSRVAAAMIDLLSPTGRRDAAKARDAYRENLLAHLTELDSLLRDDEILLFKPHNIEGRPDFSGLRHIRPWPDDMETYHVLSACDALVSDYSSVMFDFAVTRRKIVRFEFDLADYADRRGFAINPESLPFPRVDDVGRLAAELRLPRAYDDTAFLTDYCAYESPDATRLLLEQVMRGTMHFPPRPPTAAIGASVLVRSPDLRRERISAKLMHKLTALAHAGYAPLVALDGYEAFALRDQLDELPEQIGYTAPLPCSARRYPVEDLLRALPAAMRKARARRPALSALEFEALRAFGALRLDAVIILDESGKAEDILADDAAFGARLSSLLADSREKFREPHAEEGV